MEQSSLVRFVFVLCLVSSSVFCFDDSDQNATASSSAVYIVTLKHPSSVHSSDKKLSGSKHVLTATSSRIYKTLYVEKKSNLLLFGSLQVSIFIQVLISLWCFLSKLREIRC